MIEDIYPFDHSANIIARPTFLAPGISICPKPMLDVSFEPELHGILRYVIFTCPLNPYNSTINVELITLQRSGPVPMFFPFNGNQMSTYKLMVPLIPNGWAALYVHNYGDENVQMAVRMHGEFWGVNGNNSQMTDEDINAIQVGRYPA